MKNKLLLPMFILLFCMTALLAGCGGGTGSSNAPGNVNAGVPTVIKLLPVQYIAQTNSFITLKARVLDGNGNVVQNYLVSFTNMSLTGVLSAVTANTDSHGNAEVRIFSTTPGFATILAQVTAGSGIVRDRKTVYFSTNDVLRATMSLAVNSVPGNAIYDELSDFTLFETATDDTVEVLATIFDVGGVPVGGGVGVGWGSSHAEAKFIRTETETNVFGQAKAIIQVTPASIRDTETHLNISAFSDNGSGNLLTLFLQPVVVSVGTSSLTANPTTVAPGGTSALSALVKLNTGAVAPDGTTVNFTSTCVPPGGSVTPFGQTTGGLAPGTFTAPLTEGTCTVTAKTQGVVIGSVSILVTTGLTVFPESVTVTVGGTASVTVYGGNPNYSLTSGNPTIATASPASLTASGQSFIVTGVALGATSINVRDAAGTTKTVAVTVSTSGGGGGGGTAMTITPAAITVAGILNPDANPADDLEFLLANCSGLVSCISNNTSVIASPGVTSCSNFFGDPTEVLVPTIVTITCTDASSNVAVATVTVNPPGLTIRLNPTLVIGRLNPDGIFTDDVTATIVGGTGPYIVIVDKPSVVPGSPWASAVPWAFLTDPTNVVANTIVKYTVTDNLGATASANLTVYTETTGLVASSDKVNVIGLTNPDLDTADDVTITVSGANNPFIVSWVCSISATPAGPIVVTGISGTVTFDPGRNLTAAPITCNINVTDNFGNVVTLPTIVFP